MYSLWKQLLNVCVICKLNYYSVPSKPIKCSSSAAYSIVVIILLYVHAGNGFLFPPKYPWTSWIVWPLCGLTPGKNLKKKTNK